MGRKPGHLGLALTAGLGLLLGCEHTGPRSYPPDPLLLNKRPVEGRVSASAPVLVARHEPTPPEVLPTSLAVRPTEEGPDKAHLPVMAVPASRRQEID
jgi:hypothetical protein